MASKGKQRKWLDDLTKWSGPCCQTMYDWQTSIRMCNCLITEDSCTSPFEICERKQVFRTQRKECVWKLHSCKKLQHPCILAHWNLPRAVSIGKKSEHLLQCSQRSFISEHSGTSEQTWIQDLLIQDQDQGQDSAVSRPRPRPRLAYPRPRPRPRLRCPRPRLRPRLETYKTNTGSPWLGWTVTNKQSWQAENPAHQ